MDDLGCALEYKWRWWGDSPISSLYRNLDIPYEEPLEFNEHLSNLIILRDSSRTEGSFVKCGGDPPSPSNMNKEGNSHTPAYMEVVALLTSYVCYHEEIKVVLTSQHEIRIHYFSETFSTTCG